MATERYAIQFDVKGLNKLAEYQRELRKVNLKLKEHKAATKNVQKLSWARERQLANLTGAQKRLTSNIRKSTSALKVNSNELLKNNNAAKKNGTAVKSTGKSMAAMGLSVTAALMAFRISQHTKGGLRMLQPYLARKIIICLTQICTQELLMLVENLGLH